MPKPRLELGKWNCICDYCGFRFKSDEVRKDWKGLMACHKDYEPKHPQLMLRTPREDVSVPWARPEGQPQFVPVTYLEP